MFRILRAFAWLRWRMLINSLEKTGARDTIERFSIAIEKLGPIMAGVLLIPSGLFLSGAAAASGFALARGDQHSLLFEAARYLLFFVPILCIVGPLMLPAADRTNPVRLLLLPIPRTTLYVAQSSSAFGDVWVLLMLPITIFLPVGLAAGGAVAAAGVCLVAGILLVLLVVGLTSLSTSLLHLIVRNRKRGELLALIFILVLPALSMLPGLLHGLSHRPNATGQAVPIERRTPEWVTASGERVFGLYPTELYVRATRAAASGEIPGTRLLALAGIGALFHAIGFLVFAKVLDSPGSTGARRAVPTRAAWSRTLPGLSPGGSAVALAQVRLALRTPRGRSILLSPILVIGLFALMTRNALSGFTSGPFVLTSGLSLASFGSFVSLMSMLPIAMNQFAVDKAGLTLALLSPLSDREYLAGKAVGNGLIAAAPTAITLLVSVVMFPTGSPALWLAIPISLMAIYLLVAPLAAVLSAIFPRVVDLNSIGRGSNAHGVAGLLGLLAFLAAGAPCVFIALTSTGWLHRPALTPVLLAIWCGLSYALSRVLFIPASRIFAKRRENLAMLL